MLSLLSMYMFDILPVKNKAVHATTLWKATCESKGICRLRNVPRNQVMIFLHMVNSRSEKVKLITAAAPLVVLIP